MLGGAYGLGTVFRMLPDGTLQTLLSFDGTNGGEPNGTLLQASDGNFYGTTHAGGDIDGGLLFKLTPTGEITTLVSFNYTNGYWPSAGLIKRHTANLVTDHLRGGWMGTGGTVFRITTNGTLMTLLA